MDNFIFGIAPIARGISATIASISKYQLFWGFGFGFFISTLVHGFLISGSPRDVTTMLLKDKATSFSTINSRHRTNDGTYTKSFSDFTQLVDTTKFVFGLSFFLFTMIILAVVLSF